MSNHILVDSLGPAKMAMSEEEIRENEDEDMDEEEDSEEEDEELMEDDTEEVINRSMLLKELWVFVEGSEH